MSNPLLDAAFFHHDEGRRIISVNQNKKAYLKGWNDYFERPQTEEELREQFSNGAHGLALILYPGCPFGVLDHDGPHAKEAWQTTGIELPETARNISRSGYDHLFLRMPANTPPDLKRGIRLVEASCDCKDSEGKPKPCGVDLLVNGYVILPPTPGYREDPDHPLESAALMPQAAIELAIQKQKEDKERPTGDADGKVKHGKRKVTACSLAGTMRKRGMSLDAIRAALKADSEARFNPPLDDDEIEDILKSAAEWEPGEGLIGIDIKDDRPRRKAKALTVAQYADFCGLSESFLVEKFSLANSYAGVEIPYKDETGAVVSVQRRHRLDKADKKKDGPFSWRKDDKPIPYGLWMLPEAKARLLIVEGASDVHVLAYCDVAVLGIPGASNFKPEMTSSLLAFAELVLIQEPGDGGDNFVSSITAALKASEYKGTVRAVSLPEKDPRALWLKSKDKTRFTAELGQTIEAAAPIDLYPPIPLTKELIKELSAQIRRFIFFKNERVPLLIATWIVATYVYDRFQYMPILWITSPVLGCGKSRLVDILDRLVWKSSGSVINTSAAALYYMTAEGCTFLADEVENLKNSDREQYGTIIGIINAGFAKGATVRRMVQVEGEWVQKKFPVYGPKVLSGIATVTDTIRDRSLPIRMIRKSRKEKVVRFNLRREGQRLGEIAASMALWAQENGEMIEKIYDDLPDQPELVGCDDRFLDIVDPLLSIVKFADAEAANGGARIIDELMPLLKDLGGQRGESRSDEATMALLVLLEVLLGESVEGFIGSTYLHERAKETPGLQWIGSTKALATFLSKFDLVPRQNPAGKGRGYKITKETLEDLKLRYTPTIPDFDPSEVSETRAQSGSEGNL